MRRRALNGTADEPQKRDVRRNRNEAIMAETTGAQEVQSEITDAHQDQGQAITYVPPATQADLDAIVNRTIAQERRKSDAYKEKAAKYDQLVEANKSELERAQSRAEKAESKLKDYETAEKLRQSVADVAKETGVPASLLRGNTEEELREHAEVLKQELGRDAGVVPSDGMRPTNAASGSTAQQFAEAAQQLLE